MGVRFAPSPTGIFHIGNLRTAWISHRWARELKLPWVVRFEDIDQPRVMVGAQDQQLADLQSLSMVPDELLIQSQLKKRHWEVFLGAAHEGKVYPCFCSRKEVLEALEGAASAPHADPPVYNGKCRNVAPPPGGTQHPSLAWRFRGADSSGQQDFIIARTAPLKGANLEQLEENFVPAYHWACAIDDYDGGYKLLVRAWDLAHALTQQRSIHDWLSSREQKREYPAVFHCSLVTLDSGQRLEKRTQGVTLAELLRNGQGAQDLLRKLERSFSIKYVYYAEKVWGEELKTLTLSQLGL